MQCYCALLLDKGQREGDWAEPWCRMYVVFPEEGAAVLLRSLEPLQGHAAMRQLRAARRKEGARQLKDKELCNGPSKLCQALDIHRCFDRRDLASDPEVWLESDASTVPGETPSVVAAPRIGIESHGEWAQKPLRFYLRGHPCVSVVNKEAERESGNPVRHSGPTEFWKYSATCSGGSSDHQEGSFSSEIVQFVWASIERKIFVCVPSFLLWFLINKSWNLFPQQPFHRCLERSASVEAETLHLVFPVSSTSLFPPLGFPSRGSRMSGMTINNVPPPFCRQHIWIRGRRSKTHNYIFVQNNLIYILKSSLCKCFFQKVFFF